MCGSQLFVQSASPTTSTATVTTQSSNLGFALTAGDYDADSGTVHASWTYAGSDVSGWELEDVDTATGANYDLIALLPAGQQSYDIGGVATGDGYNVRLRADYTDGSVSNYSTQSITLTPSLTPTVTATPVDDGDGDHEIEVAWTLPGGTADDDTAVSIEYRGTSTAGAGWVEIDQGDYPIGDGYGAF
jgi:hypothetical protein